jgi:uncharacterized protein (DUF1697 family)
MEQLRPLLESLGHHHVRTHRQSGNIIFSGASALPARRYEEAIAERFGVRTTFVLRSAHELRKTIRDNPFVDCDNSKIHVGFMERLPGVNAVAGLDPRLYLPERFSIVVR